MVYGIDPLVSVNMTKRISDNFQEENKNNLTVFILIIKHAMFVCIISFIDKYKQIPLSSRNYYYLQF